MRLQIKSNAGRIVAAYQLRINEMPNHIRGVINNRITAVVAECRNLSSRRFASTKQLRRMGHPYGKRYARRNRKAPLKALPVPPFYINRQKGLFLKSWRSRIVRRASGFRGLVVNTTKYSGFMLGTKKMIKRPVIEEAERRVIRRLGPFSVTLAKGIQNALLRPGGRRLTTTSKAEAQASVTGGISGVIGSILGIGTAIGGFLAGFARGIDESDSDYRQN
jgi:hypothetical protein